MRILFLSNYYPPFEIGGYEQLCRDVAEQMCARGHLVRVLTSDHGDDGRQAADPSYVFRELKLHISYNDGIKVPLQFLWRRPKAEAHDLRALQSQVADFAPEVIFIWNLQGLPRSLATQAEDFANVGVAYWLAGYSPAEPDEYWIYWSSKGKTTGARGIKTALRRPALAMMRHQGHPLRPAMRNVAVVSQYMRRAGIAEGILPPHAQVVYNGVEMDLFQRAVPESKLGELNLLYAGRVSVDKGVHIAIEALGWLARLDRQCNWRLHIAGSGPADYLAELQQLAQHHEIGDRVAFLGWQPREQMPELMSRCHVLLLPTIHQEPFARVVLEAMASGLAVVASDNGGTSEIVEHDVSGLLCHAGDSRELATQIQRMITEPGLRQRLAAGGQRRVLTRFSLERMVDDLEALLAKAVANGRYRK